MVTLRTRFILWLVLLLVCSIALISAVTRGYGINSNLLEMLPGLSDDPVVEQAMQTVSQNVTRKFLVLVSHTDFTQAQHAAQTLQTRLEQSGEFQRAGYQDVANRVQQIFQIYFPHRFKLLTDEDREHLLRHDGTAIKNRALMQLYSPVAGGNSQLLAQDPFMLTNSYFSQLGTIGLQLQYRDNSLFVQDQDRYYIFMDFNLQQDPYAMSVQSRISGIYQSALDELQQRDASLQVLGSGVFLHAAAATQQASSEVTWISTISILGTVLLFLITFGSVRPILLGLLAIATGYLAALAVNAWLFGKIHLFTLIFGSSLIGIAIDYTFHLLTDRMRGGLNWNVQHSLAHITPGLTMALLTSIAGFLSLLIVPFPGLVEMAVFVVTGLTGSYLCVVLAFPVLLKPVVKRKPVLYRASFAFVRLWWKAPSVLRFLPLVLAVVFCGGIFLVHSDDSVRNLRWSDPQLEQQQRQVTRLLNHSGEAQFFVVTGKDDQEVLEREEQLTVQLQKSIQDQELSSYLAVTRFVPSIRRQQQNQQLIATQLLQPHLRNFMQDTGFTSRQITEIEQSIAHQSDQWLLPQHIIHGPMASTVGHLWLGNVSQGVASVILLGGVKNAAGLQELADRIAGIHYVNPAERASRVMQQYRERVTWMLPLIFACVLLVLRIRYSWMRSVQILVPPALAIVTVLGLLGYLHVAINLFHVLALLLVLGIGIDYAIFFAESRQGKRVSTQLAVILSALTTLLAFGMLALSSTPAIRAFGVTVLMGILMVWFAAPWVIPRRRVRSHRQA